jgi:5-methylcytosine-specific restriction enzyme A
MITIEQGKILDNDELCNLFKCSPQGGMRRSHKTNTLVLVSNHIKSIYEDKWIDGIMHYTGMGTSGDQSLTFGQNPTLANSDSNNVQVHLFEVFKSKEYHYQGIVKLSSQPYQEQQIDENGKKRLVWMFPVKLLNGTPAIIENKTIEFLQTVREKKAKKLYNNRLKMLVENSPKSKPNKRKTISESYERDEKVVQYALRRANGFCQLCDLPAPFLRKDDSPFLEVHHIEYLSKGGADTIENVAAICPNCHRKMHVLNRSSDVLKLKEKAKEKLSDD